nr:PREDICTED: acylamino-acid-releasing enzyme-like [Apteryx mantelli mantelli]
MPLAQAWRPAWPNRRRRRRAERRGAGPMASGDEPSGELASSLRAISARYQELSQFPTVTHAALGAGHATSAGGQTFPLYTGPFACLAWSHAEKQLLYVAEKSQLRPQPLFSWDAPGAARLAEEEEEEKGEQFLYHEDWGEALSTCSMPVLCVLDIEESSVTVLEGVPEDVSPGQALWSPDNSGVVFVGWWHAPFRLGLSACSNRRSGIFYLDLSNGRCGERWGLQITWHTRLTATVLDVVQEPTDAFAGIYTDALPPQCWAADSRRALLSTPQQSRTDLLLVDTEAATVMNLTAGLPEGCWVLLTTQWDLLVATCSAPHQPPSLITWHTRLTATVLDVVQEPTDAFAGIYTDALPPQCWAADSRRALLSTPQQSRTDLLLVDTEAATVMNLTAGLPEGCWVLLTTQWDLLVATCSAPHQPPSLVVGVLPPAGQELTLRWITWHTRLTATVLDVVQEPTDAFAGIYTDALPPQCWAADSRRALLSTPQQSRTDLLLVDTEAATVMNLTAGLPEGCWVLLTTQWDLLVATCSAPHQPPSLVVGVLPPAGQELTLRWVRAEDAPPVPGVSWKTLTVQVQAPVLLCVGARDRRVCPTQALEFYRVLRARGVPVRLLWYPEGNHALSGVETEADVFGNCARWIIRHLGQPCWAALGQHSP